MKSPFQVTLTYAHHLFSLHYFLFATNSISNDLIFSSRLLNGMKAAPWRLLLKKTPAIANTLLRSTN